MQHGYIGLPVGGCVWRKAIWHLLVLGGQSRACADGMLNFWVGRISMAKSSVVLVAVVYVALLLAPGYALASENCAHGGCRQNGGIYGRAVIGAGVMSGVISVPRPDWGPKRETVDCDISFWGASVNWGGEVGWAFANGVGVGISIWGLGVPWLHLEEYDHEAFLEEKYEPAQDTLLDAWAGKDAVIGPSLGVRGIAGGEWYAGCAFGVDVLAGMFGGSVWAVHGLVGKDLVKIAGAKVGVAGVIGYWNIRAVPMLTDGAKASDLGLVTASMVMSISVE